MKGFDINPGTIGRIRQKVAGEFSNFERLKNHEDSSEFDDFLTKSIATTQTFFSKIFAPAKQNSRPRKNLSACRTLQPSEFVGYRTIQKDRTLHYLQACLITSKKIS